MPTLNFEQGAAASTPRASTSAQKKAPPTRIVRRLRPCGSVAKQPTSPPLTEEHLQAKLDAARQRLRQIVVLAKIEGYARGRSGCATGFWIGFVRSGVAYRDDRGRVQRAIARAHALNQSLTNSLDNCRECDRAVRTNPADEALAWRRESEIQMVSAQRILRFIDVNSEVRRPPLVGTKFLRERRVLTHVSQIGDGAPEGLIGLLLGQFTRPRQTPPRCSVALRVFAPSGKPAVRVRC